PRHRAGVSAEVQNQGVHLRNHCNQRGKRFGMNALRDILLKLCRREDLTRDEAREAFLHIMSGEASEAQIGGLLVGLASKGTTVEELVGAATVMREKAVPINWDREDLIIDTC